MISATFLNSYYAYVNYEFSIYLELAFKFINNTPVNNCKKNIAPTIQNAI